MECLRTPPLQSILMVDGNVDSMNYEKTLFATTDEQEKNFLEAIGCRFKRGPSF